MKLLICSGLFQETLTTTNQCIPRGFGKAQIRKIVLWRCLRAKAGNPKPREIPCLSDTVYQGKDAPNPSITTSCRAKGSSINFSRIQVSALMPSLFPQSLSFFSATLFDGFSLYLSLAILHFPSNWQSLMIQFKNTYSLSVFICPKYTFLF